MAGSSDLLVIDSKNRSSGTSQSFSLSLQENLLGTYELSSFNMINNLYVIIKVGHFTHI